MVFNIILNPFKIINSVNQINYQTIINQYRNFLINSTCYIIKDYLFLAFQCDKIINTFM